MNLVIGSCRPDGIPDVMALFFCGKTRNLRLFRKA
jgi:hypothetical protein